MARTSLVYSVEKEEEYNPCTGKYEKHIKSRGYYFIVSGAKTEEEHNSVIDNFESVVEDNGFECNSYGTGSFNDSENKINSNKDFIFLDITSDNVSEKEEIEQIYKKWKKYNNIS